MREEDVKTLVKSPGKKKAQKTPPEDDDAANNDDNLDDAPHSPKKSQLSPKKGSSFLPPIDGASELS